MHCFDTRVAEPLTYLGGGPLHGERMLVDVDFPCAVGVLLVLEDSVLAVLHSQGHLNNAVVVVVIVPPSPCFSVDLQRVWGGGLQGGSK